MIEFETLADFKLSKSRVTNTILKTKTKMK